MQALYAHICIFIKNIKHIKLISERTSLEIILTNFRFKKRKLVF